MAQKHSELIKKLGEDRVKLSEPMASHTTFGIGGPADLFYEARTTEELVRAVKLAKELKVPYFILGGGSNVLVSDRGFRGLAIATRNARYAIRDTKIIADAGVPLAKLVNLATKNALSGLEFAIGIPGTLGGAIRGNAGTVDEWIDKMVNSVTILDKNNEIQTLLADQCGFSYRTSRFKKTREIILKADFVLRKEKKLGIEARIKAFLRKRRNQPKHSSAGCIFKNPSNHSAGKLIDQCGLKGKKVGGAVISKKHANFIINEDRATAKDVIRLIKVAKKKVKEKFGVDLKEEIDLVGYG